MVSVHHTPTNPHTHTHTHIKKWFLHSRTDVPEVHTLAVSAQDSVTVCNQTWCRATMNVRWRRQYRQSLWCWLLQCHRGPTGKSEGRYTRLIRSCFPLASTASLSVVGCKCHTPLQKTRSVGDGKTAVGTDCESLTSCTRGVHKHIAPSWGARSLNNCKMSGNHPNEVCELVTEFRVGVAAETTLRIFRVLSSFGQCLEKRLAQSYTSGFTARRQVGVGSMLSRSSLCRARCI